jgi:hypothetical protein
MQVKDKAIIALTPTTDQSLLEGYFVENSSGSAAVVNAATDIPLGVILDGEETTGKSSIAIAGGYSGTALVKTSGAIAFGALLQLAADGTVITDAGTGARVIVGRSIEPGTCTSGALIEAVIFLPDART